MAISTYSELQSALASWLDRADLTARIPEFISIAESRISRKLRIREQETDSDVTLVAGTRTAALPTGFKEVKRVYLNTNPVQPLSYIAPSDYWTRYMSVDTGRPVVFTVEGSNLVFGPIPDTAYTAKVLHVKELSALSASAHGTFTSNPDLYLYGALTAAEPFLKNDKRVPMWKSLFEEILNELMVQDRTYQGPLRMRDDSNPY
jgi:hypothetical protein